MTDTLPEAAVVGGATTARKGAGLLLVVVCAVQFLDAMDIASMGPALPLIQNELGLDPGALQWVVSAYALGFGGFLLLGGRLADLYGRKKLLIGWLLIFSVVSLIGGLTDDGTILAVARLVKGISAGFTAPVAMALLLDTFREEKARNKALGAFLAIASTGFSLGLVLGGVLSEIDWRLVLFLPAVLGLVVIALAAVAVPADQPRANTGGRLDILGALTVTGGTVALVYGVSHASASSWTDRQTLLSLGGALVLLVAFVVVERLHRTPLIPLSIFTRAQITLANVCMLFFGGYVGFQFVTTLYYQDELGWTPLQAGLAFLLGGILTAATASRFAGQVARFGTWPLATLGLALLALGFLAWALLIGHVAAIWILIIQQILGGIGFAAAYPALNISAVGSAREDEQGLVSGLFNASAQIGVGLVVAVIASVLAFNTRTQIGAGLDGYRAGLWTATGLAIGLTVLAAIGSAKFRRPQAS